MTWLWIPCPLCHEYMKYDRAAGGYECKLCLAAARASGWDPNGQCDLFAAEVA